MVTRLIEPDELEKVLRPILTDESCPLHIAAEIDMNIDLMPKVDAVPSVTENVITAKERMMICTRKGYSRER